MTPQPAVFVTHGVEGVIFPADRPGAADDLKWFSSGKPWTPTRADAEAAMSAVARFLAKEQPALARKLGGYRCQYFGFVVDGKKRVYCNFFAREGSEGPSKPPWRTYPVMVLDGGDSFFQIEYDLESKQCMNLLVNGEA